MASSLILTLPPTISPSSPNSPTLATLIKAKPNYPSLIGRQIWPHNGGIACGNARFGNRGKVICQQSSNECGGEKSKAFKRDEEPNDGLSDEVMRGGAVEEAGRGGGGLDRRELMHGASIAGLTLLTSSGVAFAKPIVPPDLSKCGAASVNTAPGQPAAPTAYVNCCLLPPTKPIVDFRLPANPKVRKRRAAHTVDEYYIAKYNKAYQMMRNLPSSDPRNFMRQADIHCAFCNGAYNQLGSSNKVQVHFSWLFLPWHRWYLYFHERILAHLIGDPNFSLVYWNWDNQTDAGGNIMPTMFTEEGSSLYDAKRNPNHLPPTLNTLNIADLSDNPLPNDQVIQDNLNIMYQSVVTASTPDLFMGKKYSAGDPEPNIGGTLENAPHTAIHGWTGDDRETYLEDMGNFYSAARDPIFFAHHANVDRLWAVWNKIGGRRRDHTEPDFLDAEFLFYDEHARMVRVKVRDALASSKLGITYARAKADRLWLDYQPQPLSAALPPPSSAAPATPVTIQELGPAAQNPSPVKIDKKLASLATRPSAIPQDLIEKGLDEEELEEVLVLEEVQVPRNVITHLAVFINLPDADALTPLSIAEYVGSFVNVPHLVGEGMDMSTRSATLRFGITDNIQRLGIADLSNLTVTVVAKVGGTELVPITIKGIKIELE